MVPLGANVIDVGTDHAMIPVWLAQSNRAARIIASDVREGPLRNARALLQETHTEERIVLRLTDGLHGFERKDADTVILAGMGGETMISILAEAPWVRDDVLLILSPHTKQELLRRWLFDEGLAIRRELLVKDAGRIYQVLTAERGECEKYSEPEMYTGHFSLRRDDPLFPEYLEQLIRRTRTAALYDDSARLLLSGLESMKARLL